VCEEASTEHPFGPDMIVNLSVWEAVEPLHDYVYKTAHAQIMSRRHEWFNRMQNAYTVLWWIPAGHEPDESEAADRLLSLEQNGPGPDAFTFKSVPEAAPS